MAAELRIEVTTAADLDRLRSELDRLLASACVDRSTAVDVHVAARELAMFGLTRESAQSVDVAVSTADGEVTLVVEHEGAVVGSPARAGASPLVHGGGRGAPVFGSVTSHRGYVHLGARRGTALVFAASAQSALVAS